MSDRSSELLKLAVEALDDGRDPFSDAFLVENDVSANECFTLSEQLALGGRLLLATKRDLARGGIYAQNASMHLAEAMADSIDA